MTQAQLGDLCWHNGQIVRVTDMRIDPLDRGFTLGDGLFETLLWTGQDIRFFDDHMARLGHGAARLGLPMPFDVTAIEQGLLSLTAQAGHNRAALRLTLTRGIGPRGLKVPEVATPTVLATISTIPAVFPPVHAHVTAVQRAWGAPSARFKTLSYIDNILALEQAQDAGADDGLMRGPNDTIACATSANVMIKLLGVWVTPPLSDGALPGIVRGRLLRAGLVQERSIKVTDLETCQAACLTNALIGVRPIKGLNQRHLDFAPSLFADLVAALH